MSVKGLTVGEGVIPLTVGREQPQEINALEQTLDYDRISSLERELKRQGVVLDVISRVINLEVYTSEANGLHYVTCAKKQSFTTITESEREVLEKGK